MASDTKRPVPMPQEEVIIDLRLEPTIGFEPMTR